MFLAQILPHHLGHPVLLDSDREGSIDHNTVVLYTLVLHSSVTQQWQVFRENKDICSLHSLNDSAYIHLMNPLLRFEITGSLVAHKHKHKHKCMQKSSHDSRLSSEHSQ